MRPRLSLASAAAASLCALTAAGAAESGAAYQGKADFSAGAVTCGDTGDVMVVDVKALIDVSKELSKRQNTGYIAVDNHPGDTFRILVTPEGERFVARVTQRVELSSEKTEARLQLFFNGNPVSDVISVRYDGRECDRSRGSRGSRGHREDAGRESREDSNDPGFRGRYRPRSRPK